MIDTLSTLEFHGFFPLSHLAHETFLMLKEYPIWNPMDRPFMKIVIKMFEGEDDLIMPSNLLLILYVQVQE